MEFGKRVNLHTHTRRCKHASGEMEEYCREAVRQGISVLGFSDHGPFPDERFGGSRMYWNELAAYRDDVRRMRDLFPGLTILAGLEVDYMPSVSKDFYENELIGKFDFDYALGGVHFIEPLLPEYDFLSPGPPLEAEAIRRYVESAVRVMESGLFTYLVHPDMFTRRCPAWTPEVAAFSRELAAAAKDLDIPLEINAYGLRKEWIDSPAGKRPQYPWKPFWELVAEVGCRVVVGSDAHLPEDVWGNMDDAIALGAEFSLIPVNQELAAVLTSSFS